MGKKILIGLAIGLIALIVISGSVFAYTAITMTSQVQVQEPIRIDSTAGVGNFDTSTNTWDIGVIYPLDSASLSITFANASTGTITLTLIANPASLDGGNISFNFDNPTLEVPGGGTASVTLTANTTQSLAPGNYSTMLIVDR